MRRARINLEVSFDAIVLPQYLLVKSEPRLEADPERREAGVTVAMVEGGGEPVMWVCLVESCVQG